MSTHSRSQMWAASTLASSINENGLPTGYKNRSDYKNARLIGDVYPFVGNKINKGYVGIADNGIIVAFAGTEGASDWMNNFLANQVPFSPHGTGNVHKGFLNSLLSVSDKMISKIRDITAVKTPFFITGHSKGGAMATLMSVILKKNISSLINNLTVVTFGAPRVGDKTFKENYDIDLTRYESNLDVVPHLPLSEQEKILLPSLSNLIELGYSLDFVKQWVDFPPYYSVGNKVCINNPHSRYGGIPCDTNNTKGEILNSFCSSFYLVTAMEFTIVSNVHVDDYKNPATAIGIKYTKPALSLVNIEAYSMPSSTYVPDDSHCFVITKDRKEEWRNRGGGWTDKRPKTLVAENQAYTEWLREFVPSTNIDKCGIKFGLNGVCHTYANRELLIGQRDVTVWDAPKDYVCMVFFGKYGIGISELKQLLTVSYNNVTNLYIDPYDALNKVLKRVDNYIDDELKAWRLLSMDLGIPVDRILAKNRSAGIATAKIRLQKLIDARETLYQQHTNRDDVYGFRSELKALIQNHATDYLNYLHNINYITISEKNLYINSMNKFFNDFVNIIEAQENAIQTNGELNLQYAIQQHS